MEKALILLVAALVLYVSPNVQGTAHLSFSNNTQVNITRDGCGDTKLCVETPDNCDPAGNSSCLFTSVVCSTPVPHNDSELSFQLRGESMGYIALGLTVNASEGTSMLFICAQNSSDNGTFFFQTMQRNNTANVLSPTERIVTEIRGMVKGSVIKCEFTVLSMNTTFSVLLGTGSFDGNAPGPFNVSQESGPLNLADPRSNLPATAAPTNVTAAPTAAPTNMTAAPTAAPTNMTAAPTAAPTNITSAPTNITTAPTNITAAPTSMTTIPNNSGTVQPHAVQLLLSVLALPVVLRA